MRRAWVMLLVLLWAAMARADVPPPWSAQESWPGGTQADARLDRTVQFWGTAIPLATVFAGIEQQTGVSVACSRAGDANERVCVNLYLNPSQPPTLRELLTQLSWVTQCTFLYLAGQPPRYELLSSELGRDVAAQYARAQEEQRARNAQNAAAQPERVKAALDEIDGLRDALALTPAQAIARYRGSNDYLLLALLSPQRRAAIQLVHALTPEQRSALADQGRWSVQWSELPPEQQGQIADLLGVRASLSDQSRLRVMVGTSSLYAYMRTPGGGPSWVANVRLAPGAITPESYDGLELRAAMGEPIDLEVERKRLREADQQRAEERQEREQVAQEAVMRRSPSLTPKAEALLSSYAAPWGEDVVYRLWQVQEGAARATGEHVVSDCFHQPFRRPAALETLSPEYRRERRAREEQMERLQQEHPKEWEELMQDDGLRKRFPPLLHSFTLREWLTALCYPAQEGPIGYPDEELALGWDWGDAGDFLRFRSRHAEVWRAALLPPDALHLLDAALASRLAAPAQAEPQEDAPRPLIVSEEIALVRLLDDVQLRLGGLILREDPTTPTGAARAALARRLWDHLAGSAPALRLLAGLDDNQWSQLLGPGLNVGRDLTAQQRDQLLDPQGYYLSGLASGRGTELGSLLVTATAEGPDRRDGLVSLYVSPGGDPARALYEWQVRPHLSPATEKLPALPPFQPVSP